jgi:hypothetical protein
MHVFKHPKYYTELRKRNKEEARAQLKVPSSDLDQAISHANSTRGPSDVRPDPGPKASSSKPQAASIKHQACEASSGKHQAPSKEAQAPSRKLQAP